MSGYRLFPADVDADALATAKAGLAGSNAKVVAIELDVTDRQQFAAAADEAEQALGPIHVLCNNAGVYRGGSITAPIAMCTRYSSANGLSGRVVRITKCQPGSSQPAVAPGGMG